MDTRKLYIKKIGSDEYTPLSEVKELTVSEDDIRRLHGEKVRYNEKLEYKATMTLSVFQKDRFMLTFCGLGEWFRDITRQIFLKHLPPSKCEMKLIMLMNQQGFMPELYAY